MTANAHWLRAAGALAAIAVLAGAAPRNQALAGPPRDGAIATIGVSVPRAQYRDIANGVIHAVQLAANQANSSFVVPGVTFKVRVLDDTIDGVHDPIEDVSNAKSFISDPTVIGEIGQISSGSSQATAAIFNTAQLVQISPAEVNPDLTDPAMRATYQPRSVRTGSPLTYFRTISSDAFQGRAAALYAYRVLKVKSVYVADDGDGYGATLANGFKAKIASLGANVLGSAQADLTQFQLGMPVLADSIPSTSGAGPDLVYFGGTVGPNGGAEYLADALKARGLHTILMGGDGIFDNRLITGTHNGSALGAYATSSGPLAPVYLPASAFLKAEAQAYPGSKVSVYDTQAYDAALAIIDAYGRAVSSGAITAGDRATSSVRGIIAANVAGTKLTGATGPVSFDRNGDIKNHLFSVYKIIAIGKGKSKSESWSYAGVAPNA